MARKNFGGMGGMNMNQMMKQAQKMQESMKEAQDKLAEQEIEVSSGGGAVVVKITGKKEITAISINKDVVDPDDVEMLEDLVMTAVNEAIRQVDEIANDSMSKVTGMSDFSGLL